MSKCLVHRTPITLCLEVRTTQSERRLQNVLSASTYVSLLFSLSTASPTTLRALIFSGVCTNTCRGSKVGNATETSLFLGRPRTMEQSTPGANDPDCDRTSHS